jgi:hypothetical protein
VCAETVAVDNHILSEFFLLILLAYNSQMPTELGHAVESDSYQPLTVETCIQTLAGFIIDKEALGQVS